MKFLMLLVTFFSCAGHSQTIKVFHYNIKELDSTKIKKARKLQSAQVKYSSEIIERYSPDIISINEIQYDKEEVPTSDFTTRGKNLKVLGKLSKLKKMNYSFHEANTGMNSKPGLDGNYILKPTSEERKNFADAVNFGMFPGQYSTGGIFKYPIKSEKIIKGLKWRDFNPNINLSKYRDANGNKLPRDMELFDKNFSDITLDVNGKELHVILLHTVPAFGFGNKLTPNFERNHDQLEFLKWYLTGKSKFSFNIKVKPLRKNTLFIAMGDWNVDPSSKNPGGKIIKQLGKLFQYAPGNNEKTYVGQSFGKSAYSAQLDYILVSNKIRVLKSGVHYPDPQREEIGCGSSYTKQFRPNKVLVSYKDNGMTCKAWVSKDFYKAKKASDHLAIWAKLQI